MRWVLPTRGTGREQMDPGLFGKEPTARLILKRTTADINLDAEQAGTDEVTIPPAP